MELSGDAMKNNSGHHSRDGSKIRPRALLCDMKKTADPYRMSPKVTRWLAANFDSSTVVVELGGGGGSLDLVAAFKDVTTVEHDSTFVGFLTDAGCHVLHVELQAGWYQRTPELVAAMKRAQLIIVDGPSGWRREVIRHHLDLVPSGCAVVWDDVHRPAITAIVEGLGWPVVEAFQDGHRQTLINCKP